MLCELSQIELKSVSVGKDRLQKMTAFELKAHEERLDKVIARCKEREPHKFWSESQVHIRAAAWRGTQYDRRRVAETRLESEKQLLSLRGK